jgi:PhzF family phenazine biosynthesis protein
VSKAAAELAARRPRAFQLLDVFAETPYSGNPLAVVLEGEGLSAEEMSRFTLWMNLSETTFVLPPTQPGADYRVRIFSSATASSSPTKARELPFAGHPTIGSCHAWLSTRNGSRKTEEIVQECGAGLVRIRRLGDRLAFAAPPLIRSGPVEPALIERVASQLRIDRSEIVDAEWVDNGPGWLAVMLVNAEAVLALRPGVVDRDIGVVGLYPEGGPASYEVRAFFPKGGSTAEDPVTGSLNASLAQWLLRTARAQAPYVASQGTALGRAGRVHVSTDAQGTIWVGGSVVTCARSAIEF